MASRNTTPIQQIEIQKIVPSAFLILFLGAPETPTLDSVADDETESVVLLTGNPRVDDGEQEVDDEVQDDDDDRHEQGDTLNGEVVNLLD